MRDSTEGRAQRNKENRQTVMTLLAVLAFVVAGVFLFFGFYNTYNDRTLYEERLNQMREVTTQLFAGLEDVVRNQWQNVGEKCRYLQQEKPETMEEFVTFMGNQAELSGFDTLRCNLAAVDSNGWYYTQKGRQGLMTEREYLISQPERISFVSNTLTNEETRMVFLRRLEKPILLRDGDSTVTLTYYGISQDMEELNPYFQCGAYGGENGVYVVDDNGLKLFSSSNGDLLKGYNVFTVLGNMEYLHGSSFAETRREFNENKIAYSNAKLEDRELYYALYKMDNSAWTLIFLVPSEYVAMNTVKLVNTTTRLILIFAVVMILVCAAAIFWLSRRQQQAAVAVERRNNAKLEQVNRELAAASKAKTNFLSNMSHDIRTPMNAIVGISGLMEHELNDPEKMCAYIQKVQLSSRHLLSLINDILDMSRIESGGVVLNQDTVSLAEQMGQVDSIIRPQTQERGQSFTVYVHDIAHEYLIGDTVRLRQVIINLLSNAVKYTPDGGSIRLDLTEKRSQKEGCTQLQIAVTDNGYGMTPQFVEHIFEPFTRAENSTTNKVQGTGLGMAITKNIVDMMGGRIEIQSELGKGSRFLVTLDMPIDKAAAAQQQAGNVLLITKEELLARNTRAALGTDALTVVQTIREAKTILGRGQTDVVLLGGMLEDRGLPDALRALRRASPRRALIFCCDYVQPEQLSASLGQSGADGLISRPFFLSSLNRAIEQTYSQPGSKEEAVSVLSGMRFLCAEDNSLNAEILSAMLEMCGASCVIYPDGQKLVDAFALVREGEYDAILMDVQMPVMNGLEATRAIREGTNLLGRTIPIIAMTANAFTEDVQHCLEAGMDAHVAKPLEISVLERTVRAVTGQNASGGGTPVRQ